MAQRERQDLLLRGLLPAENAGDGSGRLFIVEKPGRIRILKNGQLLPTPFLDISAQVRIREFLKEYNRRSGATILLTSHYMADVTALCERVIIIHQGHLKYDGGLTDLARKIAPFKLIGVRLGDAALHDLSVYGTPTEADDASEMTFIQVRADQVTSVTARLLADLPVHDITITDPPIEAVIEQAFEG